MGGCARFHRLFASAVLLKSMDFGEKPQTHRLFAGFPAMPRRHLAPGSEFRLGRAQKVDENGTLCPFPSTLGFGGFEIVDGNGVLHPIPSTLPEIQPFLPMANRFVLSFSLPCMHKKASNKLKHTLRAGTSRKKEQLCVHAHAQPGEKFRPQNRKTPWVSFRRNPGVFQL